MSALSHNVRELSKRYGKAPQDPFILLKGQIQEYSVYAVGESGKSIFNFSVGGDAAGCGFPWKKIQGKASFFTAITTLGAPLDLTGRELSG